MERLRALAGPTIEFLGRVDDGELAALYAQCRAFLFAADEDFGLVPLEAQSYGRPVIAYGHGGPLETVRGSTADGDDRTGVYFAEQTVESLMEAISSFEAIEGSLRPEAIRAHAMRFNHAAFRRDLLVYVARVFDASDARVWPVCGES